ncbi:hypothetical protein PMAYCL1PPCAC_09616, partial [Pristionchus mayeri]
LVEEMANDSRLLNISRKEVLPNLETWALQTDDGTIFYCSIVSPYRLYVKWNGREIDATLPHDMIRDLAAHGNAVYFTSYFKVNELTQFSCLVCFSISAC